MAKIVKSSDTALHKMARFDRDQLEEFPAAASTYPDLPPPLEVVKEEEEEEIDLKQLRAEVLEAARVEAEEKVKAAYQEGLERGAQIGREAFEQSVAKSAEALDNAAQAMREARDAFLQSLEPQVVALSKLVAERVLMREVRTDPDLILSTVRRALAKIADRQRITIRLNPDDVQALREHKVKLLEDFDAIEQLGIESDDSVTPGGCVAESAELQVDARLETLLASVLETLAD